MEKGDIFMLSKDFRQMYDPRCYKHPFVYWEDESASFRGIMLTTSDEEKFSNIKMTPDCFEKHKTDGTPYTVTYGKSAEKPDSYIAPLYLLKEVKYEHLNKVGKLTKHGLDFINKNYNNLKHTTWMRYKNYSF